MPSAAASAPTARTVPSRARCMATAPSRPESLASRAHEVGNSAEHQPPLRPDAPKPATSRSSTAIRSDGSAFANAYAVHSPV